MSGKVEKLPWMERRTHKHNTVEQQGLETGSKTLLKSKVKVAVGMMLHALRI